MSAQKKQAPKNGQSSSPNDAATPAKAKAVTRKTPEQLLRDQLDRNEGVVTQIEEWMQSFGDTEEIKEPWRRWKVKPTIEPMPAVPAESGIGARIAYCRGQLNNLPIEALARYTKYFDADGISRQSLLRYEAGESMPGAREMRILCDALWVPAGWLLFGSVEESHDELNAMLNLWFKKMLIKHGGNANLGWVDDLNEKAEVQRIEQRQHWIDEARTPRPRA